MNRPLQILTAPGLIQQADGINFRLDGPLLIRLPCGRNTIVPAGFETDLASIPPLGVVGGSVLVIGAEMTNMSDFLPAWLVTISWLLTIAGFLVCIVSGYLKPYGRYTYAAVFHDWLFRTHFGSFTVCNWYFLLAMRQEKTARWERFLIWFNVQLFGYFIYRSEKRRTDYHLETLTPRHHDSYGGNHHLSHKG